MNSSIAFVWVWNFRPIIRNILHESGMGFIHMIRWSYLLIGVVESRGSCVGPIATEINSVIQVLSLKTTYVILKVLLKTLILIHSTYRSSSVREFVPVILSLLLVEWIRMTVSSWFSSSANSCVMSSGLRAVILLLDIETHSGHIHHIWVVSIVLSFILRII